MYKRKDRFYRQAKAAGYRSRAAYKLLEIVKRHRILKPGDHVVDLGAWPGGWLQVAAEIVAPKGRVVGVDLVAIDPLPQATITLLCGDVRDPAVRAAIEEHCNGRVDVVLSDMAPKLTGVRSTDEARWVELADTAHAAAIALLRSGGTFLVKLFAGSETDAFVARVRVDFAEVRRLNLQATRSGSAELYLLATGHRHQASGSAIR